LFLEHHIRRVKKKVVSEGCLGSRVIEIGRSSLQELRTIWVSIEWKVIRAQSLIVGLRYVMRRLHAGAVRGRQGLEWGVLRNLEGSHYFFFVKVRVINLFFGEEVIV
jgi:hypothetical protein